LIKDVAREARDYAYQNGLERVYYTDLEVMLENIQSPEK
jgi:hypothetical protein